MCELSCCTRQDGGAAKNCRKMNDRLQHQGAFLKLAGTPPLSEEEHCDTDSPFPIAELDNRLKVRRGHGVHGNADSHHGNVERD